MISAVAGVWQQGSNDRVSREEDWRGRKGSGEAEWRRGAHLPGAGIGTQVTHPPRLSQLGQQCEPSDLGVSSDLREGEVGWDARIADVLQMATASRICSRICGLSSASSCDQRSLSN